MGRAILVQTVATLRLAMAEQVRGVVLAVRRRAARRRMELRHTVTAGSQSGISKEALACKTLHGLAFKRCRRRYKSRWTKQRIPNDLEQ
jgi:hypothetical protein